MGIVVREVDRLNQLISDFLRYSRPAAIRPERVRLSNLIEEISSMNDSRSEPEIQLSLDLDPDVVVMADPSQLRAVVWNLWNNAMEAMSDQEGQKCLSARVYRVPSKGSQGQRSMGRNEEVCESGPERPGEWTALLEIEDTGPGIEIDAQARIFEPFFTTKRDGTGLGLATVQRIVEQHGGEIEVTSPSNSGSCFRVSLQCQEAES